TCVPWWPFTSPGGGPSHTPYWSTRQMFPGFLHSEVTGVTEARKGRGAGVRCDRRSDVGSPLTSVTSVTSDLVHLCPPLAPVTSVTSRIQVTDSDCRRLVSRSTEAGVPAGSIRAGRPHR